MSSIQVEKVVKEPVPPPATIDQRLAAERGAGDDPEHEGAEQVDGEDPGRKGPRGMVGEDGVEGEARHRHRPAEQADRDPGKGAHGSPRGEFCPA